MTWWKPWQRLRHNGHAEREAQCARAEAEAQRRMTKRMTPIIQQYADHMADLPDEELVARVARMFGRHA